MNVEADQVCDTNGGVMKLGDLEEENIKWKARQASLHWHGRTHSGCLDLGSKMKQTMKMEARGTRGEGMWWMDNIRHDMNKRGLEEEDAQDGRRWRRRIQNPDPARQGHHPGCWILNKPVTSDN